jgi:hypothetical protein
VVRKYEINEYLRLWKNKKPVQLKLSQERRFYEEMGRVTLRRRNVTDCVLAIIDYMA